MRFVRVTPDVAKGTPLAQEVPALIQFDLDLREPLMIGFGVFPLREQSVFLCHKVLNMIEDRLIFDLIFHESLLHRGCDRNGQASMLRLPETAVNRCSAQHDAPGLGSRRKRMCPVPFHGAWLGSGSVGSSGLFGFFGLSGSENEINEINQIDQINQLACL